MAILDKPGALAKIATCLGDVGISIDRMRQYGHETDVAPVLIVTHRTTGAALRDAIGAMQATGVLSGEPVAIRIEEV
jgi:homoserine dehydrogenase